MSPITEALARVEKAARAMESGDQGARTQLQKEIYRLQVAAEEPIETCERLRFAPLQLTCVRVILENGVLDAICAKKGAPVTAAELAKETGADELLIQRCMQLLNPVGVCDEVGEGTYSANAVAFEYASQGGRGGIKHNGNVTLSIANQIVPYMRSVGGTLYQFPQDGKKTPAVYALGKNVWEYIMSVPEQKEAFDMLMTRRRLDGATQWYNIFPASEKLPGVEGGLRDDDHAPLVIDMGGGSGHDIASFRAAFPSMTGKCILQDLPATIDRLANSPPKNVEPMAHDFFTPQTVKGARAYFLRNVMHNWSDVNCQKILSHIRDAMDPRYSSLIIEDMVLASAGTSVRQASMDILMMIECAGIERTERHWRELLDSVGLEIVGIWQPLSANYESVIEARVKRA
ncbi:putative O-methyltransferase [Viridothelium virens]|uniref:Putative O-methyltransferase n=1 Tax=Viridothelium virens TaxID=1048519 RepID=A0A6A6GYX0_VIRVR|nr:putative O-methyltransferase [Viridothelium virens]